MIPGLFKHHSLSRTATDWLERLAVAGSLVCMIHCLALPLLLAALPSLSLAIHIPEAFHLWVLALAAPTALVALLQGHAHHGNSSPLWIGLLALLLLAAGALLVGGTSTETLLTVAGSVMLAAAHILNWRLRHSCAA